jgi:hypothetical protein
MQQDLEDLQHEAGNLLVSVVVCIAVCMCVFSFGTGNAAAITPNFAARAVSLALHWP